MESVDASMAIRDLKVLIIDDEALMAEYFSDLLITKGCVTTVFNDSVAALEHLKSHKNSYSLVLSDINMPKLRGDDLAKEILNLYPDMPVILCSGEYIDKNNLQAIGVKEFLQKPIDSTKLFQIINELKLC